MPASLPVNLSHFLHIVNHDYSFSSLYLQVMQYQKVITIEVNEMGKLHRQIIQDLRLDPRRYRRKEVRNVVAFGSLESRLPAVIGFEQPEGGTRTA